MIPELIQCRDIAQKIEKRADSVAKWFKSQRDIYITLGSLALQEA